MIRVLALANFPVKAAATRFRIFQFCSNLKRSDIDIKIRPFLSDEQYTDLYSEKNAVAKAASIVGSLTRRVRDFAGSGKYDILLVQREAMFFGPAMFEWLIRVSRGIPMVLDLDDATWIRYESPTFGRLGSALKFFGKTDRLIKAASVVTCGNEAIADYVRSKGGNAVVIPSIVDPEVFRPMEKGLGDPVIGWIGTHSTFPFVESLFPVLQELRKKYPFTLRLVGTGRSEVHVDGITVENLPWELEREPQDFGTLDIGLYPLISTDSANEEWLAGKSGLKAIQYMTSGVPFVMSPVGICKDLGIPTKTHFNAATEAEWSAALERLLADGELRASMGAAGRDFALDEFSLDKWSEVLASVLKDVAAGRK